MIAKPLFSISIFTSLAALWLALASPTVLAASAAASDANGVRAPAKAGTRAGPAPTPASRDAEQAGTGAQVNHDQYALRPERDVQPRSSFGLRMKPGWQQQDDPGR
ncbi:hypothetical protein OR16_19560 [Cupriavidus basilensis OR16]|uniref:Uncharacterized protein n=1 Tax=Cupriavidus basilensis OR16 TaxID=1127483 RepID=H1S7I9_9BURK|nr:hypothetical protein [Cupriavidus basilensis]EHP41403.1 hypothetical protein OR16_19560 [Cupriavidus basilensis OR16]